MARVALVTGGTRGIGEAISKALKHAGRTVVASYAGNDAAAEAFTKATGIKAMKFDAGDYEACKGAVETISAEVGPIEILVNNAGITRDAMLFKMTDDEWDSVIAVNLRSAFLMSRECQKHFSAQKYGKIVSLSSRSALGNRGQANYAASKAGVMGLTATLAIELGPFGINVNAVAPGYIATAMTDATARRIGLDPEEMKRLAAEQTPVRRVGTAEDIAATVAFLAADESSFISGQTIQVNGGANR
jgi:3-oxoacyl-[acyl-carrier protein] reductase